MAALATLLSMAYAYEDVREEAARLERRWRTQGLEERTLQTIAAELGAELVARRRRRLDRECGVLVVMGQHFSPGGHYVAVVRGMVLDPGTGVRLPWRVYLARYGAQPGTWLALVGGLRGLRAALAAVRAAAA